VGCLRDDQEKVHTTKSQDHGVGAACGAAESGESGAQRKAAASSCVEGIENVLVPRQNASTGQRDSLENAESSDLKVTAGEPRRRAGRYGGEWNLF